MGISSIKGFNDILPPESDRWRHIEEVARRVFRVNGFSEIRIPIMEKTELFSRSIGDATDIVEKEMYSFPDKSGSSVTLRPEGTAGVMRAVIQHKLHSQDSVLKLFYMGPMFRYERPQKGRYRQFHQIGAEITGTDDPMADAQLLNLLAAFFKGLDLKEPELQINSLGCPECRPAYRVKLTTFLEKRIESMCEDCRRRFDLNPLRILDCKLPGCIEATSDAPAMLENLCNDCVRHFNSVQNYLHQSKTKFVINPRMVRGLDYYTRTTFEMVTDQLGSQSAVAAGGRYDGLISQLGGGEIPGVGFAMGIERIALLLRGGDYTAPPELFIATIGEKEREFAFGLMNQLMKRGVHTEMDYEGKSLKSQMRRANRIGASYSVVIGENEVESGKALFRRMSDGAETEITVAADKISELLNPHPATS